MTKFGEAALASFFCGRKIYRCISSRMDTPQVILQQLASIAQMERGSLSVIRQTSHGPCCNFQRWENGRHRSEYIPADQVALVQENLQAHARFAALVEEYVALLSARSRDQRLAGVQKKRLKPTSASRRKPKSKR